ncbi:MAG TPA: FAD-dependent monooxygenase, partial [Luteimonas sp.]|nr:FAD-dependent monooxygenase [Luteimonas sp.]
PDGTTQACAARYLAGCDGARSTVREQLGIGFEGGTYRQVFYVADVELAGLQPAGEVHVALGDGDFVAVLPYGANGQYRLVGTVRDERADHAESLAFADVDQDAIRGLGLEVRAVHWFSTYRVHHRVADTFRQGRAFLLGDAGHIHSPAGGQGMNTGILDANNLAWKLADVLHGRAPDALLDSYSGERLAFARTLVQTTDRVFSLVTAEGTLANAVRMYLAPTLASVAGRLGAVRETMFRTVSQTLLDYRGSALSAGRAGAVQGGDRLPWVRADGTDNYDSLVAIGWQVHVYGAATPALHAWCTGQGIALHVFAWQAEHSTAGYARDAAYLLRPDTYVALASVDASPSALATYFAARGYRLQPLPVHA